MDIALLSETHLLKADIRKLADKFHHVIASSSASTMVQDVAKRSLNIKVPNIWAD